MSIIIHTDEITEHVVYPGIPRRNSSPAMPASRVFVGATQLAGIQPGDRSLEVQVPLGAAAGGVVRPDGLHARSAAPHRGHRGGYRGRPRAVPGYAVGRAGARGRLTAASEQVAPGGKRAAIDLEAHPVVRDRGERSEGRLGQRATRLWSVPDRRAVHRHHLSPCRPDSRPHSQ